MFNKDTNKRNKNKGDSTNNIIENKEKSNKLLETKNYDFGRATLGENYKFLINVKIGSNNQEFNLILDTSNYITWVAHKSSNVSQINNYYNPNTSYTSKQIPNNTFSTNFMDSGNIMVISGDIYTDNFKYIGDQDFNMTFGVATFIDRTLKFDGADGIISLAYYYRDEQYSFLHMLKKYGITNSTLFSIKFGDKIKEGTIGYLFIGKHEDFSRNNSVTFFLNVHYFSIGPSVLWDLNINYLTLKKGNTELYSSKYLIEFATNINYIVLPKEYLDSILNKLKEIDCSPDQTDENNYRLKCLKTNGMLPDLIITINGTSLTIPSNYIFTLKEEYHYSNIYFNKDKIYCVLGAPFFFAFHTLFDRDNEQIHFYPNNHKFEGDTKSEDKKWKNMWIIISAIAAGVILLIFLIIIIYCCCIKSKKSQEDEDIGKDVYNTDTILES